MPPASENRGVSPVIGAVLMFAIVVMLAATAGVMALGVSDSLNAPPPFASSEESVTVEIQGNDTQHTLEFVHRGGDAVDADALSAEVRVGDQRMNIPISARDSGIEGGEWRVGERLELDLNTSMVCTGDADSASVTLTYADGGTGYELSSQRVPIERGQFVIDGARVEATAPYTANVKFVGTGWSSPAFGDSPVNVSVGVDGTTEHTWRMVGDSDSVVGAYGVSRQEAGTSLEVAAAGLQQRGVCINGECVLLDQFWTRVSSTDNTDNVRVYRDGDDAPDFGGADDQQSAAAYVDPYVEDDQITLDDNQAIYLFDFNDDTHDYQDAVVLVSFFTQEERSGVYESGGEDVVICPPETKSASPNGNGNGNGNGN